MTIFEIERHGLGTPCCLSYTPNHQRLEIVRFPHGLASQPVFSPAYQSLFEEDGIPIPADAMKKWHKPFVVASDPYFGEAFYRYYFPNMIKHDPDNYHWELV
jgi:hypothetical protein